MRARVCVATGALLAAFGCGGPSSTAPLQAARAGSSTPATPSVPGLPRIDVATSELTQIVGATDIAVVVVPGAYEASSTDQAGHVTFWRRTPGSGWRADGVAAYPYVPDWPTVEARTSTRAYLLAGMAHGTFLVSGEFTGDNTGDTVAYTRGPRGWGPIVRTSATTAAVVTAPTDDESSSAQVLAAYTEDGTLAEIESNGVVWSPAGFYLFPLVTWWRWSGERFVRDHANTFTARLAAPPAATSATTPCLADAADGSYTGWVGIGPGPGYAYDGRYGADDVDLLWGESPGGRTCFVEIGSEVPLVLPAVLAGGRSGWVEAPVWLGSGGNAMPTGTASDSADGSARYVVPSSLGITRIAGPAPVTEGDAPPNPVAAVVTMRAGQVVSIALTGPGLR